VNPKAFDLADCPRVRIRDVRATRALLGSCALLSEMWPVVLPPLGPATVTFAGYAFEADGAAAVDLSVSFGVARGRVSIEAAFAVRVVDAVLGGGAMFSPLRAAGAAERGVLAGVLAPVFDRLGGSVHIGPLPPRDGGGNAAAIAFRLETVIASGWLRLTPPAGGVLVATGGGDAWQARATRIPVRGYVEIAATNVPAAALAGVAVGDAIVFDGARASAFVANAPWNARLRVGDHAADVTADADGKLLLVGGFSPLSREEGNMSASGSNTDTTTVLAAASIEVVAEIGRISLRGDELLGLAPGAVLATGKSRTGVTLRVGGEVWAEGEIVDIDGELGVRITRLANR
jgi:type III secretion system YscQ/HrcQ family protein